HEEAAQSILFPSLDLNDDDMEELSSLHTQEQEGNDAAQRLRLAFPTHVVTNEASSILAEKSSSVSPASTPTASAGNTLPVSPRPSAGRSSKSAGNKSISASRDTNSADRHPSKLSSNGVSERFPPASNTQNSDIHDGLKLFDYTITTKKVNEAHHHSLIIGDLHTPVQKRKKAKAHVQSVWVLVELPKGKHAIGTKWILKNKRDARGIVCRNKARLVAQGHRQKEGIDYTE
nr:putative ribonuclease H-like domain-containing protein [Tanacetum cinerariifolium]